MKDLKVIVFGANASMRMGGEAQKPLRMFDAYRDHGWSPTLVVHQRNIDEIRAIYAPDDLQAVHVLCDTKLQIWVSKTSAMFSRVFAPSRTFFDAVIWLITQREMQKVFAQIGADQKTTIVHVVNPISIFLPLLVLSPKATMVIGPLALGPGLSLVAGRFSDGLLSAKIMVGKLLNLIFTGKRKAAVAFCDGPLAMDVGSRVFGTGPQMHDTLHNGVDDSWFEIDRKDASESKKVLFVGRLDRWKGVHHLIKAVVQMADDVTLDIVGDGPERAALMALAGPQLGAKITFIPWLDHDAIQRKYIDAAVFVSPSYAETGGTSVQEAMAMGIPVIATSWGGHVERVPDGCGFLIDPPRRHKEHQFVDSIVSALQTALGDRDEAQARAARARQHAYDNFRWKKISGAMIETIEAISQP